jgi:tetratricopeptide (TPR) repeat protein
MTPKDQPYLAKISGWRAFVLLGLMLFLAYSNTFDVPFQFDDYHSILGNAEIHAQYPHLSTLAEPFASLLEGGRLDRQLAMTTFAVNWYLGKNNPFGYHVVNLAIHILTAYFLFLTLLALFDTPRLTGLYRRKQVIFISLLASALWAVNPIQVQAVTYIVQRMASLCGMFYVLSIYFYVNARCSGILTKKSVLLYAACCLSFLAGFLTKQNAALLPVSLLLVEAAFFQDLGRKKVRLTFLGIALALGAATVIGGALIFYDGNLSAFVNYEKRLFTPFERLLTQPRVLLFYLTLIFYPAPHRLSLVHDIEISTSFYHPWMTLPSILIILVLIGLAIYKLRKWPILSFAVLFFFINHAIESSIIPLELIFEHRNYLPGMFLFWPVAVGLERLIGVYRSKNATVYYGLVGFVPLLLIGLGTGTYVRNIDWSSEKYLWEDAMAKAPRSSRPYHNLAMTHYERIGDRDTALALYHRAIGRQNNNISQQAKVWNNIAAIYHFKGDFQRAGQYWQKCVESYPNSGNFRYRLAMVLAKDGRLDEALAELNFIISKTPQFVKALNLKAAVLLLQERPHEALALLQQSIRLEPRTGHLLINVGASFHALGDYRKADLFFREALRRTPRDRLILLWRIKNQMDAGDTTTIDADLEEIVSIVPVDKLTKWLRKAFTYKIVNNDILIPAKDDKLIERIQAQYLRKIDIIGELSESKTIH